jgi:phosphoserine aminotransferase
MEHDLRNVSHTNLSIYELSHRSKEYAAINQRAIRGLRALIGLDEREYSVLLMPGGATLQFAASIINLQARMQGDLGAIDYLVTGHWSEKAAEEAERLGFPVRRVNLVREEVDAEGKKVKVVTLPDINGLGNTVYYCQNETIDGIELPELDFGPDRHVICDCSSNILSRPLNPHRYTILFAGAQKNVGVAGATIVIAKRRVAVDPPIAPHRLHSLPTMLDYKEHDKAESILNTPPAMSVYVVALVVEWLTEQFGTLHELDAFSQTKASSLYSLVDPGSTTKLYCPIQPVAYRSRMNVVLRVKGEVSSAAAAEDRLVTEASARGIEGIKGHRSAGGLRISLYNSISVKEVEELRRFLLEHMQ